MIDDYANEDWFVSKEEEIVADILVEYLKDETKLKVLKRFYDIAHKLEKRGILVDPRGLPDTSVKRYSCEK